MGWENREDWENWERDGRLLAQGAAAGRFAKGGSSAVLLDDTKAHKGVEDVQLCLTACVAKRNLRYVCANNIVLEEGEQQAAIRPLRGRFV